jgi:hypothetical protein
MLRFGWFYLVMSSLGPVLGPIGSSRGQWEPAMIQAALILLALIVAVPARMALVAYCYAPRGHRKAGYLEG